MHRSPNAVWTFTVAHAVIAFPSKTGVFESQVRTLNHLGVIFNGIQHHAELGREGHKNAKVLVYPQKSTECKAHTSFKQDVENINP